MCVAILITNDFYFKPVYHNWLTGKLSDVFGISSFALFWAAFFHGNKIWVYFVTAFLFAIWKSPYSESFIIAFSENFYSIHRVVDFSDLIAILFLPIVFKYSETNSLQIKFKLNPIPLAIATLFAFCATSIPRQIKTFQQPQYLLFKSGVVEFNESEWPSEYKVHTVNDLIILDIKKIELDQRPTRDDEYHKIQVLKELDIHVLKSALINSIELKKIETLRDSLLIKGRVYITLSLDSFTDSLTFKDGRLDSAFRRYSKNGNLLINGYYKDGIEDSTWNFYDSKSELISKNYFESGQLTKTEYIIRSKVISSQSFKTRADIITMKYFMLAIILLLVIGLIRLLHSFRKKYSCKTNQLSGLTRVLLSSVLPLFVFLITKLFSSLLPEAFTNYFLGFIGEFVLVYLITFSAFLLIFFFIKIRKEVEIIYYTFIFSMILLFIEEFTYLIELYKQT